MKSDRSAAGRLEEFKRYAVEKEWGEAACRLRGAFLGRGSRLQRLSRARFLSPWPDGGFLRRFVRRLGR